MRTYTYATRRPLFAVKVRFQTPEYQSRYNSTFNALTTIVREERFTGLFKGIMSPIVCTLPIIAVPCIH